MNKKASGFSGEQWISVINKLAELSMDGNPLAGWVFHGTSLDRANQIEFDGVTTTDVLMRDRVFDVCWQYWSQGTFWGTPKIAAFYAEDLKESLEDPDLKMAIIAVKLSDLESNGIMVVDEQSIDCPLDKVLGQDAESLFEDWNNSEQTWIDSLRIYGSVACLSPIGPEIIRVLKDDESFERFLCEVSSIDLGCDIQLHS